MTPDNKEEMKEIDNNGEMKSLVPARDVQSENESDPGPQMMCKGGKYCPGTEKCCYNSSGDLAGCCKFIHGVCCSDGKTCCKKGLQCLSGGGCTTLKPVSCSCKRDGLKCCSDTECCPEGFECDLEKKWCTQDSTRKMTAVISPTRCQDMTPCTNGMYCPASSHCLDMFGVCISANSATGHMWVSKMSSDC